MKCSDMSRDESRGIGGRGYEREMVREIDIDISKLF